MANERIILTRAGYDQLTKELAQLEEMQQGEIEQVADAFDDTDYGDNAVFYDAVFDKDRLNERINNLKYVLARADVIDEDPDPSRVSPGDTVTVWDMEAQEELTFRLVSAEEVTHGVSGISMDSPVGQALLDKQIGDVVTVKVPDGMVSYTIRRVE
jgi:transcription elongation factor GreA